MSVVNRCVGAELRRLRRAHGWTLYGVQDRSQGRWKHSVVGSYERAERVLSLPLFVELCRFYRADPTHVLELAMARLDATEQVEARLNEDRKETTDA